MQILETKLFPLDGIKIEVVDSSAKAGKARVGVIMSDTDAQQIIEKRFFANDILPMCQQRALRYFNELVRKCVLAGDQ
jgi:hypothetical protein